MPSPPQTKASDILERIVDVRRRALAEAKRATPAALEAAAELVRQPKGTGDS